jgi:CHRD domain
VRTRRTAAIALTLLGAVVLLAGCGKDEESDATSTTTAKPVTKPKPNRIKVVSATLSGPASIPKGPAGARGSARITLNLSSGRACWSLTVSGTDKPLSAHVHLGAPGKVGEVVIPLGDTFSRRGCVLSVPRALRVVAGAPSHYYVDVHTTKNIQGAMRGQLRGAST